MKAVNLDEVFMHEVSPCGQCVHVRYRPGLRPGIITRLEEEARAEARARRTAQARRFWQIALGVVGFVAGLLTGVLAGVR